jgi:hypothetical protein
VVVLVVAVAVAVEAPEEIQFFPLLHQMVVVVLVGPHQT